jgi:glyoxylase-like metal-dependent hydrolase (beta-lactamase superfamily II)
VDELGAKVAAVIHTHTHIDHVGATAPVAQHAEVVPQIHEADRFLYDMLPIQAALIGGAVPESCELRGDLSDGSTVTAVAFTGDTLFRGSIGRTDLWGGDSGTILSSLRERLMTLDDDTRVITGHGPDSTIGDERAHNPFLKTK